MRAVIFVILLFLNYKTGLSQDFSVIALTADDSAQGIFRKYQHEENALHGLVQLTLKFNRTYLYTLNFMGWNEISEGRWKIAGNTLTLTSSIQKDDIPIKVSYDTSGDFVDSFNIAVVKNLNNEPITEAFVVVNNDSTKCLPLAGGCSQEFDRLKRVKVLFENGLSSQWVHVRKGKRKVQVTVLTALPMANYLPMLNKTFKIEGDVLKPQD